MKTPPLSLSRSNVLALTILVTFALFTPVFAQQTVSIGDTQTKANAVLYLKGNNSQGLIIPIVSSLGAFGESGMLVFNSTDKKLYYHNGTAWAEAGGGTGGGTPVALTAGQNITITGSFPNFTIAAPNVDGIVGNEITQVSTRGGLEVTGAGTTASPLTVGIIQGTTDGQILKWNDATQKWVLAAATGAGTVTSVATGTGLSGGPITATGTISLANTAVTAGTYGGGTNVPQITVDAQGRITAASNTALPDASATNEIQNLAFSGTGSATPAESFPLDISSGTGVTFREGTNISITQSANVLTLNSTAGGGSVTSVATGTGLTGGPVTTTGTISLANTAVTPGSYGNGTNVPQLTVDAQGRITAASNIALPDASATNEIQNLTFTGTGSATPSETFPLNISSGSGVSIQEGTNISITQAANVLTINSAAGGGSVTSVATGTGLTGGPVTTTGTISLANTAVTPGSYGNASNIAQITVDAQGRITSASNVAVAAGATTLDGLSDATVTTPATGNILVHNGAGQFANVSVSGDANLTAAGALTLTAGSVSGGVGGKITDGSITSADLAAGAVSGGVGGVITDGSVATADIADGTILNADVNAAAAIAGTKIAPNFGGQVVEGTGGIVAGETIGARFNVTAATVNYGVVGRSSGTGSANYGVHGEANGAGTTNYGVYGAASGATNNWAGYFAGRMAIAGPLGVGAVPAFGTAGQVLTSNGTGAAPTWTTVTGGSFSTLNVIPKGDGSGQVASQLFDNGTNVGIGTTTPVKKLDINGDLNLSSGSSIFVNNVRVFNNTGNSNTFLGSNTGLNITANHNTFLGFEAGRANTAGTYNLFVGRGAGTANLTGSYNAFIGADAGLNFVTGNLNTFVGFEAGFSTTSSVGNTFVGNKSAELNTTGEFNTFVGERSGQNNTTGTENTIIGRTAGLGNTTGSQITLVGHAANVGSNNLTNATAIGEGAVVSASDAVVLGNNANVGIGVSTPTSRLDVYQNISGAVAVSIRNPNTGTAAQSRLSFNNNVGSASISFFGGNFPGSANTLRFANNSDPTDGGAIDFITDGSMRLYIGDGAQNGNVGIGRTPTANKLEVNGDASKTVASGWAANSDARIKTDIKNVENGIETVKKLRPVMFRYSDYWRKKNPHIKDQFYYNFIAQEFQQVFPEAVKGSGEFIEGDSREILQIDTYNAEIVTIKAVQELIEKVERLEQENLKLRQEKETTEQELKAEISEIKKLLGVEAKKPSDEK